MLFNSEKMFGFRNGVSTVDAVSGLTLEIYNYLDNRTLGFRGILQFT